MFFSTALLSSLLVAGSLASPVSIPNAVHEKRTSPPQGWTRRDALDRRAILPMRIALTQGGLDQAPDWLMDVSHPESEKFGQHWSAKDVAQAFAPSDETVKSVKAWLTSSGIGENRIKQSQSLGWLEFDATVDEAEDLLETKYHVWEHTSGQPHVACDEYKIPTHLKKHVDFVTPTVHFDAKIRARDADNSSIKKRDTKSPLGNPNSGSLPKLGQWLGGKNKLIQQLEQCDTQITPNCLRALYEFPPNVYAAPGNSLGIVEYSPQAYVGSDLDLFFANFSTRQVGDRPTLDSIDGGVVQSQVMSFNYNGESDLDLEYAMTLVYPQKVTLYQVGDLVEGASFSDFLDALDGSFCVNDDPTQDATYPDPYPGGYKGPKNCGGFAATKVISTSYGYNEYDLTPLYEQRQCNEYLKLGLQGVSFVFSSGDYGVAGNGGQCIAPGAPPPGVGPNNLTYTDGSSGRFNPAFPSTCPYITSVGATQVKPGTNIIKALATHTQPEEACETVIYSGGGFSNVFPLPSYQSAAVKGWFKNHPPPYGADRFNNSQQTRGFPDVSANGANYVVAVDGQFALVYGTSASAPVFASILTLINEARLAIGKKSVGFINPTAYAHPEVWNDITQGGNQGCGTPGFSSATGWDPVTGLGTPNFPKLLKLYLSLP
ncbi:hypothetical protein LTR95_010213 [Oleoguttula sp. CCFEE 5521]